jgi:cobalt-zinc-cadmium efflux system outer membrane protein
MIDPISVALLATATSAFTLEGALALALEQNPELRALEQDVSVARDKHRADSRWFRENPELSAAAGPRFRSVETTLDVEATLEQPLELFGQRGLRTEASARAVESIELRVSAKKNELVYRVRAAFAHALAAGMRVQLAKDIYQVAEDTLRAAEERHRSGAASRLEVSSARVELGRAANAASGAERELATFEAELAELLALETIPMVTGDLAEAAEREVKAAKKNRAELQAAERERESARLALESAARDAYPGLRAGAKYTHEEGAHLILGTVSLELPFFERNQLERAESSGRAERAAIAYHAVDKQLARELALAERQYAAAKRATNAYAGAVLRAIEENFWLATEAYRAGKFDFIQLTLVRRETLDARRGYIESLEALNLAEAELLRAIGAER